MSFIQSYGLFTLKALTTVFSLLILFAGLISIGRKNKTNLSVISLNKQYEDRKRELMQHISGKKYKKKKKTKKAASAQSTIYVIDFKGDIQASQVDALRLEVSSIISAATPGDQVLLRLESPGGSVNGYGLAASQLQRLREHGLRLTVCIDKVAASGGYLMACVAHHIIAAPFAILGSIGVVAQIPNFHRLLKKNDIDVEVLTAGEYKRTLTLFGENTEKGRQKFTEDLELIHKDFRDYVLSHRENINIEQVATGEHWLATNAIALGLVDALQTSDDYLMSQLDTFQLISLKAPHKTTLIDKILNGASNRLSAWIM